MRQQKLKSGFSEENYRDYLNFCKSTGLPYTVLKSNYTLEIVSEFCNIKFAPNMGKKAFIAGAMIKRDIKNSGVVAPDIDSEKLTYFNFAPDSRLMTCDKEIYNIDIKSAYASVLYQHSLITTKTANYLKTLSKKDRLACVGMLAAKKEVFTMVAGKPLTATKIINENAPFFYFCINRTNEIMHKCQMEIGHHFLFYWVDGIFFNGANNVPKVCAVLDKLGYRYSVDVCKDIVYSDSGKCRRLSYNKGDEKKELSLPKKNNSVDEFLINFLYF